MLRTAAIALAASAAACPAQGQEQVAAPAAYGPPAPPPATAEEVIDEADEKLGRSGARRRSEPSRPGEIVVTASRGDEYRVPSSTDEAINEGRPVNDGHPRAPDVSGLPPCAPVCISIGRAPPPIYMIDLKAIPEAPAGSDAARYAEE